MIARIDRSTSLSVSIYDSDMPALKKLEGKLEAITSPDSKYIVRVVFNLKDIPQRGVELAEQTTKEFTLPEESSVKYQISQRIRPRYKRRVGNISETLLVKAYEVAVDREMFMAAAQDRNARLKEPGLFEHIRGVHFGLFLDQVWINYYPVDGREVSRRMNPLEDGKKARAEYPLLF